MLNEKITVTIGGRNYKLVTDNAAFLLEAAEKIDKKMEEYCTDNIDLRRDDAAVYSALEISNELTECAAKLSSANSEIAELKAAEAAGRAAVEENKRLRADSGELKKLKVDFDKLLKRISELEGKNGQLAETLKTANEKASESEKLKSQLALAQQSVSELEKKNSRLSQTINENSAEIERQKKTVAERDKRISEIMTENKRAVSVSEENKRLLVKLDKAQNFEEAFNREKSRADKAEAEAAKQKELAEKLSKDNSEQSRKIAELDNKIKSKAETDSDYEELAAAYDELEKTNKELKNSVSALSSKKEELEKTSAELNELKVKYSQIESENAALKQDDIQGTLAELEKNKELLAALTEKNAELMREVKALKKTNASLDKQLKEMLEDGQLTL